jgi:hypothetical protein
MMPHLDDVELVDAVDGLLSAQRGAHLQQCERCAGRLASLRGTLSGLQRANPVGVPEPSPLFWEHFSRRVHEAVHNGAAPARARAWWRQPRVAALSAAASVLIAAAAMVMVKQGSRAGDPGRAPIAAREDAAIEATQPGALDVESDADWALVQAVADDLPWEETSDAGIHARPGAADGVAIEMSAAERQELARLLEDAMKRSGA